MKKFSYSISVVLIFFVGIFLFNNPDEITILKVIKPSILFTLIFIKFITLLINSKFNQELLKVFNLNISNVESLYLGSITFLGNLYLPARSGGNLRMLYLNRKYKFKSPALASMYLYFFSVTIFLNSFIGIVCLILMTSNYDLLFIVSIMLFSLMLVFSYLLTFKKFSFKFKKGDNKLISWIEKLKNNWNLITTNKIVQRKLIFLTFLNYLFFALEAYILIELLFDLRDMITVFYYNSISVLSSLASFTPASLGIKDTMVLLSGQILNLTTSEIISLMIVERALLVLFSILPSIVFLIGRKD